LKYEAGINDAETVKVWARGLDAVVVKQTSVFRYTGGSNALCEEKGELTKGPGDRVRFLLRALPSGDGVSGTETLEGNEEGMEVYYDDLLIDQLRYATRVPWRNIDQQRVPFEIRAEGKNQVEDWATDRLDTVFFNVLCGYTPIESQTNNDKYNGFNTITEYDSASIVRPNSVASDETLGTSDRFNLDVVDKAVHIAKTRAIPIRPLKIDGDEYYIMFLHPNHTYDLRTQTSDQWYTTFQNALQGSHFRDNPLFTGGLGIWNKTIFVENNRVTPGVNSSTGASVANARRAVLCGAQAMKMAYARYGGRFGKGKFSWVEKGFDYDNELGISVGFIYGMKRSIFNSQAFGSLLVPTYAPNVS
jgi:N4-gp56 family major capsid protein